MEPKVFGVIGAGPVGGILTAHLCAAGHTVALVDVWREQIDRIRSGGLHIFGREEILARPKYLFTSSSALREIAPEFVFLCTKACDLENVVGELYDALGGLPTVFVSAQNGLDTEDVIAARAGRRRALRLVINYAGVLAAPGEIRATFFNPPNHLGWLDEGGANAGMEAAALLCGSGLETRATPEIKKFVWKKVIFNSCSMPIAAVTGMNIEEHMTFPPTRVLVELLLAESIAVAASLGYDYGPGLLDEAMEYHIRAGPHRPSMLVDIENGRRTENRYLNRRIAEYAEEKGVPAPTHRALANLVDAVEKRSRELHSSGHTGVYVPVSVPSA